MVISTHSARVTGPLPYTAVAGTIKHVPLGPCLLESPDGLTIDLIWGAQGQNCVALKRADIEAARDQGSLVLLD